MKDAVLRLGLVGLGQIARMRHLPAIAATGGLRLVAVCDPAPAKVPAGVPAGVPVGMPVGMPTGVASYTSLDAMIGAGGIDAVVFCTPPQVRYALARQALSAGLHVLLEKPPTQTVAEIADLAHLAEARGLTLFTAWHSVFAGGVAPARAILCDRGAVGMRITWQEDVHTFHPGVDWFWQPGGMGVFDPGVNALSIAVTVLPEPLFVREARFTVRPGEQTPVTADLVLATPTCRTGFEARFDWEHRGQECWTIDWTLRDGGRLELSRGGGALGLDGRVLLDEPDNEYPRLYAHFAVLVRTGRSDVETRPLMLAADAFTLADRTRHIVR